jgi:hypothetical protein
MIEPKRYPLFKKLGITKEEFYWIHCPLERESMSHDYKLIVKNGLQQFLKNENLSFLWITRGPEYHLIQENCWPRHTGATLARNILFLEQICTYGYYTFMFRLY